MTEYVDPISKANFPENGFVLTQKKFKRNGNGNVKNPNVSTDLYYPLLAITVCIPICY